MALRAQNDYEVMKQLPEIGWRASKQYFNVRLKPIKSIGGGLLFTFKMLMVKNLKNL